MKVMRFHLTVAVRDNASRTAVTGKLEDLLAEGGGGAWLGGEVKSDSRTADSDRRPCLQCGEPFMPRRVDAKYCSPVCRQKASEKRLRDRVASTLRAVR